MKEVQEGVKHFVKAIEIQPEDYAAQTHLGSLLLTLGKKTEGFFYLELALEINPYHFPAWKAYLIHLVHKRQFDKAKDMLREAKRRLGPDPFESLEKIVSPSVRN